jgi:hypothetical protein
MERVLLAGFLALTDFGCMLTRKTTETFKRKATRPFRNRVKRPTW